MPRLFKDPSLPTAHPFLISDFGQVSLLHLPALYHRLIFKCEIAGGFLIHNQKWNTCDCKAAGHNSCSVSGWKELNMILIQLPNYKFVWFLALHLHFTWHGQINQAHHQKQGVYLSDILKWIINCRLWEIERIEKLLSRSSACALNKTWHCS